MAWNPSPKVADCREIAKKWQGKTQVIIIAIDDSEGTIEMATYGATQPLCREAKRLGDYAYDAIMANYDPETQQNQSSINVRFLIDKVDGILDALDNDCIGTWQMRAEEALRSAKIAGEKIRRFRIEHHESADATTPSGNNG